MSHRRENTDFKLVGIPAECWTRVRAAEERHRNGARRAERREERRGVDRRVKQRKGKERGEERREERKGERGGGDGIREQAKRRRNK